MRTLHILTYSISIPLASPIHLLDSILSAMADAIRSMVHRQLALTQRCRRIFALASRNQFKYGGKSSISSITRTLLHSRVPTSLVPCTVALGRRVTHARCNWARRLSSEQVTFCLSPTECPPRENVAGIRGFGPNSWFNG